MRYAVHRIMISIALAGAAYGSALQADQVASATVASDDKTLFLELPEISPTWCMEVKYSLLSSEGKPVEGVIHNTIHALGE